MRHLLTLFLAISLAGCSSLPVTHGVPNLHQVSDGVWRGGQPTAEGFAYLRSLGVSNVIKLNLESEGSDQAALIPNGMLVRNVPINLREQLGLEPISPTLLEIKLRTLKDFPELGSGLFIHCEHGQDRTGLFMAMYRVRVQGWSKADAEKEMLADDFHKDLLPGLWDFWKRFQ